MDVEEEPHCRSRWESARVGTAADGSGLMEGLRGKVLTIVIDSLSTSKRIGSTGSNESDGCRAIRRPGKCTCHGGDLESIKGLGGKKVLTIVIDSLSTSERQLHLKGQTKVMGTERYNGGRRTRQGGRRWFRATRLRTKGAGQRRSNEAVMF